MQRVENALDLPAWKELIARSFVPMGVFPHPEGSKQSGFEGSITRLQFGSVGLSRVSAGAHIARRSEREIRLHPADYYKASLQIEGKSTLIQGGREVNFEPGTLAFYDSRIPYELSFAEKNVVKSRGVV